jgi:hypothetical protein
MKRLNALRHLLGTALLMGFTGSAWGEYCKVQGTPRLPKRAFAGRETLTADPD